jgi:hypothetical protein
MVAADMHPDVSSCIASAGASYAVGHTVSPVFLRGDFDGNGKADLAVAVSRNGKRGIVVCRAAGTPIVLGAGVAFNDMADLDFSGWSMHPRKRAVARGAGVGRPPALAGDALLLEWESGSGLVYWNGKRFVWYQQGD